MLGTNEKIEKKIVKRNKLLLFTMKEEFIVNFDNYFDDIYNLYPFLSSMEYKIVEKTNTKGFSMKWHLDDCIIFKHSKPPTNGDFQYIQIDSKRYYTFKKRPRFSVIVYHSKYNVDFKGGILEFQDNTRFIPDTNKAVIFDCNQVHRVTEITDGVRRCTLIKFY